MILLELAALFILATATWLVLDRSGRGDGRRYRRTTTALLAAGGAVVAASLVTAVVLAF